MILLEVSPRKRFFSFRGALFEGVIAFTIAPIDPSPPATPFCTNEPMQTSDPSTSEALMEQLSIARQPIVDAQRTVVAYELFNRSQSATSHSLSSDVSFALHALAESGAPFSISNCDLFINTVHQALGGSHWDFIDPAKTVIEVPMIPGHVPQQIAESAILLEGLHARGFRLSFRHSVVAPVYKPWQTLADFVKVELSPATEPNIQALVAAIRGRTGAIVVAEKIEHAEQFEAFKALGVERFQGFWFSVPELVQPRVLTPGEKSGSPVRSPAV